MRAGHPSIKTVAAAGLTLHCLAFAASETSSPAAAYDENGTAVSSCFLNHADDDKVMGDVIVTVTVDADGQPVSLLIPDDTYGPLADAARCAALKHRYVPAIQAGEPVPGTVLLTVGFPMRPQISSVDSLAVDRCYPWKKSIEGIETDVALRYTVDRHGMPVGYEVVGDVPPWVVDFASCAAGHVRFQPGFVRGVPIYLKRTITFYLRADSRKAGRLEHGYATPNWAGPQWKAAVQMCLPPGRDVALRVGLKFIVGTDGRVKQASVIGSSGDPVLDQAAVCLIQQLRFIPPWKDGKRAETAQTWPLTVHPLKP